MKTILLLLAVFAITALSVPLGLHHEARDQFTQYMRKYNKAYTNDEFDMRFANYKASVARVLKMNSAKTGAKFGINKFSDMSVEEFRSTILMTHVPPKSNKNVTMIGSKTAMAAPTTFDWRTKGAVTPVKNQGQCGSCWAFSATEAIESAWILKGHATSSSVDLAPQQIVDCDTIDGVQGCNGGLTESAYDYIVKAGGQEPESDYPYTAKNGACRFNAADVDAKISGYTSISNDETALPNNLATIGPLSICLDAAHWQDYQSGVMSAEQCCPGLKCQLDHCVQLVGYDQTASTPYWIVRNSWATDWGNQGYIWLSMGHNTCGLTNDITWPTSD